MWGIKMKEELRKELRKLIEKHGLYRIIVNLSEICWDLAEENSANVSGLRWNQKAGALERLADELEY